MKAAINQKFIAALFFLIFLSGCVKERYSSFNVGECEARLSDIPIPLNVRLISSSISDTSFSYLFSKPIPELVAFYACEMESFGWDLWGENDADEFLLIFKKPYKIAIISLRHDKRKTLVRIDIIHSKK